MQAILSFSLLPAGCAGDQSDSCKCNHQVRQVPGADSGWSWPGWWRWGTRRPALERSRCVCCRDTRCAGLGRTSSWSSAPCSSRGMLSRLKVGLFANCLSSDCSETKNLVLRCSAPNRSTRAFPTSRSPPPKILVVLDRDQSLAEQDLLDQHQVRGLRGR